MLSPLVAPPVEVTDIAIDTVLDELVTQLVKRGVFISTEGGQV